MLTKEELNQAIDDLYESERYLKEFKELLIQVYGFPLTMGDRVANYLEHVHFSIKERNERNPES